MNFTNMESDNLNMKMLKPLDEVLRCPICSEFFNNCVMSSCSHDFCSACLKKRMTTESDCPICYEDLRESDLRNNDSMDKIVRIYKKLTRVNGRHSSESRTQNTGQSQNSSSLMQISSQAQNILSVQNSSERIVPIQDRPRTQSTPLIHIIQPTLTELTSPIKIEIADCDDIQEINEATTSNQTASSDDTNVSSHKSKSLDTCEIELVSDNENLGRGYRIKKRSGRYNEKICSPFSFSLDRNMVDLDESATGSRQSCESSLSGIHSDQAEISPSIPGCSNKINTDPRGVKRGNCLVVNCDCSSYEYYKQNGAKCNYCCCPPTKHKKIEDAPKKDVEDPPVLINSTLESDGFQEDNGYVIQNLVPTISGVYATSSGSSQLQELLPKKLPLALEMAMNKKSMTPSLRNKVVRAIADNCFEQGMPYQLVNIVAHLAIQRWSPLKSKFGNSSAFLAKQIKRRINKLKIHWKKSGYSVQKVQEEEEEEEEMLSFNLQQT